VVAIVAWQLSGRLRTYRRAVRRAAGRITGFIAELFGAVQAVKVARAEDGVLRQFKRLNIERRDAALRDTLMTQVFQSINHNMVNISIGIVLIMVADQMRDGGFTVGDFALFTSYLPRILMSVASIGNMIAQAPRVEVSEERLQQMMSGAEEGELAKRAELHLQGDFPDIAAPESTSPDFQELEVRGLSYHFPGSEQGIREVSFSIPRGSFTVVTGRIGAGKTTLLRAILSLVHRDSGEILLNGQSLTDPGAVLIPPLCAYTPQTPRLFSDALGSNILLGLEESDEAMQEALRLSVMERDLSELEHGLGTLVGPRGVRLSGGQMQRSSAARMFIRGAHLLIFDDLSSALDVETEQVLWEQLFEKREHTCLVATHRRLALRRADQIVLLEQGRVTDVGPLDELLQRNEEMRRLWQQDAD
jgi:ABC-type multidrug transport system fused ATPase/permease subunit